MEANNNPSTIDRFLPGLGRPGARNAPNVEQARATVGISKNNPNAELVVSPIGTVADAKTPGVEDQLLETGLSRGEIQKLKAFVQAF